MSTVDEAIERVLRKKSLDGEKSLVSAVVRLGSIEDLTDAVVERGTQQDCRDSAGKLTGTVYELAKDAGTSAGTLEALRRAVISTFGWLDVSALKDTHARLLAISNDTTTKKDERARIAQNCYLLLGACHSSVVERRLQSTLGNQLLESLLSTLPQIDKLPDTATRLAALKAIEGSVKATTVGVGPTQVASFKTLLKQIERGYSDKDSGVKIAALRCVEAASSCCTPLGAKEKDSQGILLNGPAKLLEDRNLEVRFAAAEAVARVLQVGVEQNDPNDVEFVGKARHSFETIQKLYADAKDCGVREAVSSCASLFAQKCARITAVPSTAGFVAEMMMAFLAPIADKFVSNSIAFIKRATSDRDMVHSCRCIAAAISSWCATVRSQRAKVHIVKKLLAQLQSEAPKLSPFAVTALYALPDIFKQMQHDSLSGLDTVSVMTTLVQCGSHCASNRHRVDVAFAVKSLAMVRPLETFAIAHYLVSILIDNAGNAFCGYGTPCDHQAIKAMTTAGAALLSVLPHDSHIEPSIKPHLTELCSVARAKQDPVAPDPNLTAIDPLARLELAFLMETCLACCEGVSGLHTTLPKLTQKVAQSLKVEKEMPFPKSANDAVALFVEKGVALLSLVSVLRFARNSGKDLTALMGNMDPELLVALENSITHFHNNDVAWKDDGVVEIVLCKCRTLAYEAVSLLPPTLGRTAQVYKQAAKTSAATLCSIKSARCSITRSLLKGVLAPSDRTHPVTRDLPPAESLHGDTDGSRSFGEWHHMTLEVDVSSHGALLFEKERQGRYTDLIDTGICCLATTFVRQGKDNKKRIIEHLAKEVRKEEKAVCLNVATFLLLAMGKAVADPACREVLWSKDPFLLQTIQATVALCRTMLALPCQLTRMAAAEAIGLASSFMGFVDKGVETIDTLLPFMIGPAAPYEASALSHCIGALHAHNPEGRLDVLGLSLAYLQKLAKCDSTKSDESSAVRPAALAALARVVRASGFEVARLADDIMYFACEHVVSDVRSECSVLGYAAQCSAAGSLVVDAMIASLGDDFEMATPGATQARILLLHGLDSDSSVARAAALRVAARIINDKRDASLRISLTPLLLQVMQEANDIDEPGTLRRVASLGTTKLTLCTALCDVLLAVCRRDAHAAAETLGPQQLYHLLHAVATRGLSGTTESVRQAAICILDDCVQLLRGNSEEKDLGSRRSLEWVETAGTVLAESNDSEDVPEEHRMGTKEVAAELLCRLLIAMGLSCDPTGLGGRVQSAVDLALRAADPTQPVALQRAGVLAVAALVDLFKPTAGEADGTPHVDQYRVTRIGDLARKGLDPSQEEPVRHAAARLAAVLINSNVLTPGGVSNMVWWRWG